MPAYLSNWQIIPDASVLNYDTRVATKTHVSEEKMSLQCKSAYTLPQVKIKILDLVKYKIMWVFFQTYAKQHTLQKCM